MELIRNTITNLSQYKDILNNINSHKSTDKPMLATGITDIHKASILASLSFDVDNTILVVTEYEGTAKKIAQDINTITNQETAEVFVSRDLALYQSEVSSREYEQLRLSTLTKLQKNNSECKVIIACIDAVLSHTIPPNDLLDRKFCINCNDEISIKDIAKKLVYSGYELREQVDGVAQFCIRGGILDVFPPNYKNPIRIELWGDTVDTMATFDIETQRRFDNVDMVDIVPANEVLFASSEDLHAKLKSLASRTKLEKSKATFKADLERIESGLTLHSLDKYMTLAYETTATILDYIENPIVVMLEYGDIIERAKNHLWQLNEDYKALLEEGELASSLINFNDDIPMLQNNIKDYPTIYMDNFTRSYTDVKFSNIFEISALGLGTFSGQRNLLKEEITPLIENNHVVFIYAGIKKACDTLAKDLKELGFKAKSIASDTTSFKEIPYGEILVLDGSLTSGFEFSDIKITALTLGRAGETKAKKDRFKKGKALKSLTDLQKGDLVVHVSHGIGIFEGIDKIEMDNTVKDYIKISYAGTDVLYVPVVQLDSVSKYIGTKETGRVKLNKFNSVEWKNTKTRAKKAVDDMADELIELYAKRMQLKGFAFAQDTEWQKDFEQHFPYVETDDQLRCIEEIKLDMEKTSPMDRVLCGDVGFGKTEVAMRACFKAVMGNKQVALLCPTTILAWQHFLSFEKRFEGFPMRIEVLSRFKTPKQQKQIIKDLKAGLIDIVIGTHRVVQKDIEFKDLGLAIIDEEQRFGVKHKERFKEMFSGVDMLTLSATPIPRTLNMAISGIRDMSVIEQAPQDRHPVQSYVIEHDFSIIIDALKKEIRRGGQAYYIHNKVDSIAGCAGNIQLALPEARIRFAHGRMDEKELSEIWRELVEHEIDILVCTTIIETGVDVANCNTLIVEDADKMGLSQLYQLRGRVGRSTRRAFAYFSFTKGKSISEIATKRLQAIREFTKFGSGFHIAMRDLEIRGAGSILGANQHGHMEAIGYDLYIKLLSQAIAKRKGEEPEVIKECLIDLKIDAHIPEQYIETTANRIDVYKKIATVSSNEDKLDIIDELIDRFGEPPKDIISLIDVAMCRNILASLDFVEIVEKPKELILYPRELNMEQVSNLIKGMNGRIMLNASNKPYIIAKPDKNHKGKINSIELLQEIISNLTLT